MLGLPGVEPLDLAFRFTAGPNSLSYAPIPWYASFKKTQADWLQVVAARMGLVVGQMDVTAIRQTFEEISALAEEEDAGGIYLRLFDFLNAKFTDPTLAIELGNNIFVVQNEGTSESRDLAVELRDRVQNTVSPLIPLWVGSPLSYHDGQVVTEGPDFSGTLQIGKFPTLRGTLFQGAIFPGVPSRSLGDLKMVEYTFVGWPFALESGGPRRILGVNTTGWLESITNGSRIFEGESGRFSALTTKYTDSFASHTMIPVETDGSYVVIMVVFNAPGRVVLNALGSDVYKPFNDLSLELKSIALGTVYHPSVVMSADFMLQLANRRRLALSSKVKPLSIAISGNVDGSVAAVPIQRMALVAC